MIAGSAAALSAADEEPQETPFYIPATGGASRPQRALKHNDTFAVLDNHGDIGVSAGGADGLFNRDTRYLSYFELRLNDAPPLLLGSHLRDDNAVFTADLTNPDFHDADGRLIFPKDLLHIRRTFFVWQDTAQMRFGIRNHGNHATVFKATFHFTNDFADIFEVRGARRARRGRSGAPTRASAQQIILTYRGLNSDEFVTSLFFDPAPTQLEVSRATFEIRLEPGEQCALFVSIGCNQTHILKPFPFLRSFALATRELRRSKYRAARIGTSSEAANRTLRRSLADLTMLTTATPQGAYPYAGVPWYSTTFGRDGIITALQMMGCAPHMARGVLARLAALQADSYDAARDAEPGKIIHEVRGGEMARLREVPFGHYYGSVDSTPLFLMLAGAYAARTGDYTFIREIWPHIEAALGWIDGPGDRDGDGFVEYARTTPDGLSNQGWKDSYDSVFHSDGRLARGPIALAEVQAYVFEAKRTIAHCARALGKTDIAARLEAEAARLAERFQRIFWIDEIGTFALALDGDKKPCRVRTSNAGHVLYCGLARPDQAKRVVRQLTSQSFLSGWGIRTVAQGEARYNPMSYHNGSIWPHDNALIALGFSRYGYKEEAATVLGAILGAASYMEIDRLPELYCGFKRSPQQAPTLYPVACAPQAWASAAPFALLQAALGLTFDPAQRRIVLSRPQMPKSLEIVYLSHLEIAGATVDLAVYKNPDGYSFEVFKNYGNIDVVME